MYEDHPATSEARRGFSVACIPFDRQSAQRLQALARKAHTHRPLYFATCHALQGLQPLYLIPNTPGNAARIAAQALLICSLYQLATWLGEVAYGKVRRVGKERLDPWGPRDVELYSPIGPPEAFSEPRHPEFAAYLLGELKLAKKVGVLPLAANEALTSI